MASDRNVPSSRQTRITDFLKTCSRSDTLDVLANCADEDEADDDDDDVVDGTALNAMAAADGVTVVAFTGNGGNGDDVSATVWLLFLLTMAGL